MPAPLLSRIETVFGALAWTALVLALVVSILASPGPTSVLVRVLDIAPATGLAEESAYEAGEQVRVFVTSSRSPRLPERIEGRPAFEGDAVEHLVDVREALSVARNAGGAAALVLAVWVGVSSARARWQAVGRATSAGGWTTMVVLAGGALFAVIGFDNAFRAFHGLFFEAGTWLFPSDSLLIQLFPERFWMAIGALGVVIGELGGLGLVLAGRRLRTSVGG